MSHPLLQAPVLIFTLMTIGFMLVLGPVAAIDIIRARKD
ncbi:hypothetical protein SAMN06295955_10311 [Sphingopyxis indica]|uniref:Uncharacterized protein n=1 Tax=Sphingopyxis indica TaxID=436663 RepID=A0A239G5A7_9SPHN|nr:hypothetical protein SAMN06295955_10311 [Sphingopyxis indica]